jgi:large subunit ribosomal protein L22
MADVRAFQRTTRQSPYKMRLVIDQIRGKDVNEALALLQFSKKHAARQIEKVLHSAVANAEHKGRVADEPVDVDTLYVKHAIVNEGPKLKRFTPAAMGRATPVIKRTSHVEIIVAPRPVVERKASGTARRPAAGKEETTESAPKSASKRATGRKTAAKRTGTKRGR